MLKRFAKFSAWALLVLMIFSIIKALTGLDTRFGGGWITGQLFAYYFWNMFAPNVKGPYDGKD